MHSIWICTKCRLEKGWFAAYNFSEYKGGGGGGGGGRGGGEGVFCDLLVKCVTGNLEALGSRGFESSWVFRGSLLWQDNSEPKPSTGEVHEIHEYVNCRCDATKMELKVA